MSRREPQALNPAIVEQAIQWLVRLRFNQADEQTQRTFEHWLQQRPEHVLAWQRVETLGDEFAACQLNWPDKPLMVSIMECGGGKA